MMPVSSKRGEIIAFRPNGNENAHYCIKASSRGFQEKRYRSKMERFILMVKYKRKNVYTSDLDFAGIAEKKSLHWVRQNILF